MLVPLADRIVEVIAKLDGNATPKYRNGSGCIVRGRTVLTAAHIIIDAQEVWVRGPDKVLRDAGVQRNFVGNPDGPDLALLEIDDNTIDLPKIDLAMVDRRAAAPVENCNAVGYPQFAEEPLKILPKRETAEVWGFIPALSGLAGGLLTIHTRNSPQPLPLNRITLGESEWSGMSGAPVLVEGCLLGVVSRHPRMQGTSAITVVPLTALELDLLHPAWGPGVVNADQWWERLGVTGADQLRLFPTRAARPEPEYRAQIRTIMGRTTNVRDREQELTDIAAFAVGSEDYLHLIGGAKAGKTALVADAVIAAMPPSVDAIAYFLPSRPRRFSLSPPSDRTNREEFLAAVVPQLAYLLDEESPYPDLDQFRLLWNKATDRAAATGRHLLLIIDGLNNGQRLRGLPSLANLLPEHLSEYTHVLVTSRPCLKLPRDVSSGHPLRAARLMLIRPYRGARGKAVRHRRKLLIAALLTATVCLCSAELPEGGTVAVAGNITLVRQYNNQPAIIFMSASGGIGYFTRPDDRWWRTWTASYIDPHEPALKQSTTFASGYGGFEVLGNEGGTLMFAWRSNSLQNFRWNNPVTITVGGKSLKGMRGRPGFLEYPAVVPGKQLPIRQFLALTPQGAGGVGLYERVEPGPTDWGTYRWGLIARQLDRIDFVTAAITGDGTIVAVLRVGNRLYEVSHPQGSLPQGFGMGWSIPIEIRAADGSAILADGDPELINAVEPPLTLLELAVPVEGGLELLTPFAKTGGYWKTDRLPVHGRVDSVSVLGGSVGNRDNIDVVYRSGFYLLNTWKWDNGEWSLPTIVKWGASS